MNLKEVTQQLEKGDNVVCFFGIRRQKYYIERNGVKVCDLTYKQYLKLIDGFDTKVHSPGGFTFHVTKIT